MYDMAGNRLQHVSKIEWYIDSVSKVPQCRVVLYGVPLDGTVKDADICILRAKEGAVLPTDDGIETLDASGLGE